MVLVIANNKQNDDPLSISFSVLFYFIIIYIFFSSQFYELSRHKKSLQVSK